MKVTFLGLGKMGHAMAGHVLTGGHDLTVWNRSPGKAGNLLDKGAQEAASVADAARNADVIVIMLFDGASVSPVLQEVIGSARPGTLVIDCTTIGAAAAQEFGRSATQAGLRYVDAPVVGSIAPATDGTLGIVAGGSEEDIAAALPFLQLWGDPDRIRRVGDIGSGNALKSVINLTLGVAMGGIAEALRLAHDLALDRHVVLDVLEIGPLGFSAKQKRKMIESGEFDAATFTLDAMIKDLDLALNSAHEELPVTGATKSIADEASAAGHGEDDYSSFAGYFSAEGRANST
jgi:3-hydroxyisobutyrate dehydrogenase-like beta-hydroxyacid dehydrogenase